MPLPSTFESVARADLVAAVDLAAPALATDEDRAAVMEFARSTARVAIGAWALRGCRCPVSAVGIDRLTAPAQRFADLFDFHLGVDSAAGDAYACEVVDDG